MQAAISLLKKHRHFLISAVILMILPVLFNVIALWQEAGSTIALQLIRGTYRCYGGFVCNPLPKMLLDMFGFSLILTGLALLIIHLSTRASWRRLHPAPRFALRVLLALPTSAVISYVSGSIMPLSWLPVLHDYLLGLPASPFASLGSWVSLFPATAVVLILAIHMIGAGANSAPP